MIYLYKIFQLLDFVITILIKDLSNFKNLHLHNMLICLIICKSFCLLLGYKVSDIYLSSTICVVYPAYFIIYLLTLFSLFNVTDEKYKLYKYYIIIASLVDITILRMLYTEVITDIRMRNCIRIVNNYFYYSYKKTRDGICYIFYEIYKCCMYCVRCKCLKCLFRKKPTTHQLPQIIKKTSKLIVIRNQKSQLEQNSTVCAICLTPIIETIEKDKDKIKDIIKTNCGHEFCKECINNWIKVKDICPVCNKTNPLSKKDNSLMNV